jgi:hypothetical protein
MTILLIPLLHRKSDFIAFSPRRAAPGRLPAVAGGAASLWLALVCAFAHADTGVGVDTWRANKLDPTAGAAQQTADERGTSWLKAGESRSPTGNLYMCPAEPPATSPHGDWISYGVLQVGAIGTSGDDDNALWNRYVDWDSGLILGLLDYWWERPKDGTYANVRASRISDDDQYYQLAFGRAGSYKVQAFVRDLPNVLSSNAKTLWNGVGSTNLTLPSGLTPGGSTSDQVAAVDAALPERTLKVKRSKQGLSLSTFLTPEWTAYANFTDEEREGVRPYGGPFFFAFAFPNDDGVFETPKPIDDSTININGGFRYAGSVWRMDFGYQGSFYRDANRAYYFQSPFALYTPIIPGSVSAPIYQGQMSTEPDNDYHNLQATFTRKIPMNGEISLTASAGRMSQNDQLIAPIGCTGVFGIGLNGSLELGPQNPYLYDCADWNTTNALSRQHADMRIDTSLLDARIFVQPASDVSVRGGFRFNREDYRNVYVAYNPLTGDYGYISENGAQGSIVPGEVGLFNPLTDPSALTRISSLPLDIQTIDGNVGADWKVTDKDTLGATYTFSRYEPTSRERSRIDDNSIKLTWVDRALDWLTFRANYTYLNQSGDSYNFDPYEFTYSDSLPGYIPPEGGTPAHTVDALRKYDMSSRDENKIDLMATIMPRSDMTISASIRGDWNSYDAEIGRQDYDTYGATLNWEWQPSTATSVSAFAAADHSRLKFANVQDQQAGAGADPTLGGDNYTYDGVWWLRDTQRDYYGGATFKQRFAHAIVLDAQWNYIYSRGTDGYNYAGASALAYPDVAPDPGPGGGAFPPMVYRVNSLSLGVTFPIASRVSMRLFDTYEKGRVSDWHYLGFDALRVIGNRVYTDGGPESYSVNLIGVLLTVQL